ncbi:hypothetical protein PJP10_31835, partial [Mycobacterium kansasii]
LKLHIRPRPRVEIPITPKLYDYDHFTGLDNHRGNQIQIVLKNVQLEPGAKCVRNANIFKK